jgi:hypothetical protein
VGKSELQDIPTTPGAFDTSHNGASGGDGFVTRVSSDGSALLYSTFLGSTSVDEARDLAVGADGSATVVGSTFSETFPTTPGAFDPSFNGWRDAFVTRLSPDGAALLYSTFLGGESGDFANGVVVAMDGSATVAGYTSGLGFPVTPGAFDTSYNGGYDDAFVAWLSGDGAALLYSTFLGGTGEDAANDVVAGEGGAATIVGHTSGLGFPAMPGAYDITFNGGPLDAFIGRLDISPPPFVLTATALNDPVPRGDRLRFRVTVTNHTAAPFIGGLILNVEGPGGVNASRTLASDAALAAGQTISAAFAIHVPGAAPLGSYTATVTLLEGGTTNVAQATFTFEVIAPGNIVGSDSGGEETAGVLDEVEMLDSGGLQNPATPPSAAVTGTTTVLSPNPASGIAAVAFSLAEVAAARLVLYDVLGREVLSVDAGYLGAGVHRVGLDLSSLPAGVYVWRLSAGDRVETGRLTVAH